MNVKNAVVMEVTKNERIYALILPVGAPFGEAADATFELLSSVLEMSKEAAQKIKDNTFPAEQEQPVEADVAIEGE